MVALNGLEKFSHLEDKIYRTIELTKTLRQEKENLEKELSLMRRDMGNVLNEKERLETQVKNFWRNVTPYVQRLKPCWTQWRLSSHKWWRSLDDDGHWPV